jgi:hypothetical protein
MMPAALIYALAPDDQRATLNCLHAAGRASRDQRAHEHPSRRSPQEPS